MWIFEIKMQYKLLVYFLNTQVNLNMYTTNNFKNVLYINP